MRRECVVALCGLQAYSFLSRRFHPVSDKNKIALQTLNPSGVARSHAPATLGVPFPKGTLKPGDPLRLQDEQGNALPSQTRPLCYWHDGSVKWLLLDYQADFETGGAAVFSPGSWIGSGGIAYGSLSPYKQRSHFLLFGKGVEPMQPEPVVNVKEGEKSVTVTSDHLELVIPRGRFRLFESLSLDGKVIIGPEDEGDIIVEDGAGQEYRASRDPGFKVEVEESGPLRSVIKVAGCHLSQAGESFLNFVLKYHVYAHAPWLRLQYQFINLEEPEEGLEVARIAITASLALKGETRRLVRNSTVGYDRISRLVEIEEKAAVKVGESRVVLEDPAAVDSWDNYPWDVKSLDPLGCVEPWLIVKGENAAVATEITEAMENFPKGIVSEGNRLEWLIWPAWAGPFHLSQGMAKTHFLLLDFHLGGDENHEIESSLALARIPAFGTIPLAWYQHCRVNGLEQVLSYQPRKYPRFEGQYLSGMFTKWGYYPDPSRHAWPKGMLDYGDAVDHHYTATYRLAQFGLPGEVWNNNEYDFIHSAFIQFCRSGDLRRLHDAQISAQHLMDVDFVHYSRNPVRLGGTPPHSVGHINCCVVPSHLFVEGLLDYYCITGNPEALLVAIAIGENILRNWDHWWIQVSHSCREAGWPLIGLSALFGVTGDKRFIEAAKRIVDLFVEKNGDSGGANFYPADGFGTAIGLEGTFRYYCQTGDERARRFFEEVVSWRTDNIPNVESDPRFLQLLGFAYSLTRDEKYAAAGFRGLQRLIEEEIIGRPRTHSAIAWHYPGMVTITKALDETDRLKRIDYVQF